MDEQPLNLKRSARAVRQYWIVVAIVTLLGSSLGVLYASTKPQEVTSSSLVLISSPARETATQLVIAQSDPVLAGALPSLGHRMTVDELHKRVRITSLAYNLINIQASAPSSPEAKRVTEALAESYVEYIGSHDVPNGPVQARVLAPASEVATGTSKAMRVASTGLVGALVGFGMGAIVALVISRSDKRLRDRDQIAQSVGSPVLAAIAARVPTRVEDWRRLLQDYQPAPVDAFQLRRALKGLWNVEGAPSDLSVTVFALRHDRKALAVGPELAAFASSHGIPVSLTASSSPPVPEALRAALQEPWAPMRRLKGLRVASGDDSSSSARSVGARLAVVVTVVDGRAPFYAEADARTDTNILAVSAGFATREQLVNVAASAAVEGHPIDGVILVDPDPADSTTGRVIHVRQGARPRVARGAVRSVTETRQ